MSVVQVLLKDPRVDVTLDDKNRRTPLWMASCYGHCTVVEWLIASGRDLGDIYNKEGKHYDDSRYNALEIAQREKKPEVVTLLESFMAHPKQTRLKVRVKLLDELTAKVFALVILMCDDLLQLKPDPGFSKTAAAILRYFAIASQLPMELQMVLCHRAVGSMRQNVLHKDSEAAFRALAEILLLPSHLE